MPQLYKVLCKPHSHFSMMYKSDTIFGAVCWAVRYMYGNEALEELLNKFDSAPPFLLSSMMPLGYVYKPLIHPHKMTTVPDKIDKTKARAYLEKLKKFKRVTLLPVDVVVKYQNNIEEIYTADEDIVGKGFDEKQIGSYEITRNAIDRVSLHALQGVLFTELYMYATVDLMFYVKVMDDSFTKDWFSAVFETVGKNGLGKDCSVGKGIFTMKIEPLSNQEQQLFNYNSNTFCSLSVCAGKSCKPVYFTTFTRYGKLGGLYSQAGINNNLLYCKKPIVFYSEGSVFMGNEVSGSMIHDIHSHKGIVQYGYAFPLYFGYKG